MKLVQLITRSDTVGGAQKYILETSNRFKEDGHDVTVIAGGCGVFCEEVKRRGLRYIGLETVVRDISFFNDLKSMLSFRRVVKSLRPDAVMIHSTKAGLIGRVALTGINTKVIFIAHGWSHIRSSKLVARILYGFVEYVLSFFSDKVICISEQDVIFANSVLKIPRKKISLVYSGVRDPFITNELSTDSNFKLLTVTRFQHPKDFNTLLIAMNIVNGVHNNWVIDVLGDGDDLEHYRMKTIELGLANKINFLGFQKDMGSFYRNSDVVLLISKSEGLPLSLIEAMSYQKPIIASNVGGVCELIDDGITGYLVPSSDPQALSQVILNLFVKTKMELASMGYDSYEKYRNEFDFEQMMSKLYEHINS